jgi:hypothetical protein
MTMDPTLQQQTQAYYQQPQFQAYPQQPPTAHPYYQQSVPVVPPPAPASFLGLDVQDTQFWKGVLLGAAVTLLVTNESVQKGVMKGFAKITAATQCGIEEMKEKFEDAKAEAQAEAAE